MKRFFNILLIVSIALLAILVIAFASLNDSQVTLNLFFFDTAERSLAIWLILTFLIGLCLGGFLVYLNMWFNLRRQIRAHRREHSRQAANVHSPVKPGPDQELTAGADD